MIAIFQENVGAEEVMSFDNLLLGKEAELHDLYVAESKFKEAGLGLFAAKGEPMQSCNFFALHKVLGIVNVLISIGESNN
jgi:hypothetical protein